MEQEGERLIHEEALRAKRILGEESSEFADATRLGAVGSLIPQFGECRA
jgi:hypothetical protein